MRRIMVIGTVALLLVAGAACGGSDDSGGSGSGSGSGSGTESSGEAPIKLDGKVNDHGTKTLSGDSLEMELDDYYFSPTFVKAKGGTTVEVKLHNEGSAKHTFTIDALNIDKEVAPDATETVTVKLPDSGSAVYHCRFHDSSGMQGGFAIT